MNSSAIMFRSVAARCAVLFGLAFLALELLTALHGHVRPSWDVLIITLAFAAGVAVFLGSSVRFGAFGFWTVGIILVAITSGVLGAALPTFLYPSDTPQMYNEMGIEGHGIGALQLSTTTAVFSTIPIRLHLQYAGTLPAGSESVYSGARMYRVLNGDAFFSYDKKQKYPICAKPLKWIGLSGANYLARKDVMWVTLFQMDDYKTFSASKPGICGAFTYSPRKTPPG